MKKYEYFVNTHTQTIKALSFNIIIGTFQMFFLGKQFTIVKALLRHKQFIFNLFAFAKCLVSFRKPEQFVSCAPASVLLWEFHAILFIFISPRSLIFSWGKNRMGILVWPETHYADQTGSKSQESACLCLQSVQGKGCATVSSSLFSPNFLGTEIKVPAHMDPVISLKGLYWDNQFINTY